MKAHISTIIMRQVHLAYGQHVLFDHLNVTFAANKCSCILGQSGVGKSTLLKLIAGLIPKQISSHISSDNNQLLSEQIAYMAQTDLLLPWCSALDNALISARLRGKHSTLLRTRAQNLFAQVGLASAEKKFPYQLSGGMRQRVALVRTLLEDKPIILMDEPFSAVDAITRFKLQTLTATLLKNRTVLLVTHDPTEALRLADEIYILSGQPANLHKIITLNSPAPRDFSHVEIMQQQARLFAALTNAKEACL